VFDGLSRRGVRRRFSGKSRRSSGGIQRYVPKCNLGTIWKGVPPRIQLNLNGTVLSGWSSRSSKTSLLVTPPAA